MARRQRKYHYIYKTTCNVTNRFYIGMHSTNNLEDGYMGSGKRLWSSINYHGKDNHTVEILEFCDNRESLKVRERELVSKDLLKDDLCMNLIVGGEGGWSRFAKDGFLHKMRNDPNFRESFSKKISDFNLRRVEEGTHKNWSHNYSWSGKTFTDEHRDNISKGKKGTGLDSENSQYNTCWITKDGIDKKVSKTKLNKYISSGWIKGRNNYVKPPINKKTGTSNGNSKLNEEKVLDIKRLLLSEDKISITKIANKFGVSRPTIDDIKKGKTWSHLQLSE